MRAVALVTLALLATTAATLAAPTAEAVSLCIIDASSGEFRCIVEDHEVCHDKLCADTPRICVGTLC